MMNQNGGWSDGGMWVWTVVGTLVVVLFVVVIGKHVTAPMTFIAKPRSKRSGGLLNMQAK